MRLCISIRGRVRPSVRPSVGPSVRRSVRRSVRPSVPRYFQTSKIEVFECGQSSNIIDNDTMSDDEVVASYVPPRYLFLDATSHLYKRSCPSVPPSRVIFERRKSRFLRLERLQMTNNNNNNNDDDDDDDNNDK